MKLSIFALCFLFLQCSDSPTQSGDEKVDLEERDGWRLVWSEEFDGTGWPSAQKWSYDVGGHGWGNNELQYYTERRLENCHLDGGVLNIVAWQEQFEGSSYTSARLVSRGKGDWTYGRLEVRARLPHGRGTWPAIWMLPTEWTYGNGGWPDNGEIDIMEHVGYNPGVVHASTHTNAYNHRIGTQKTATINVPDAETDFHVYSLEWSADTVQVFIDSTKYFTHVNDGSGWQAWPFDKDFHLILNLAIGGDWGGLQGVDNSVFPQRLEVDYVRVYERVE
jgi:beta-glucanase (GH16 family)